MHRLIVATFAAIFIVTPTTANACYSWQIFTCGEGKRQFRDKASKSDDSFVIRNRHRERIGTIEPDRNGSSEYVIRNERRERVGTIERDGSIRNRHRERVIEIPGLPKRYWWRE